MLFQLHHQSIKNPDKTIFCIQDNLPDDSYIERRNFLKKIIAEAWEKYPPPEGYRFMFCTEKSHYFLLTLKENNHERMD